MKRLLRRWVAVHRWDEMAWPARRVLSVGLFRLSITLRFGRGRYWPGLPCPYEGGLGRCSLPPDHSGPHRVEVRVGGQTVRIRVERGREPERPPRIRLSWR